MDGLLPVMNTCDGFSQYESYGYGATQRGLDLFQDDDKCSVRLRRCQPIASKDGVSSLRSAQEPTLPSNFEFDAGFGFTLVFSDHGFPVRKRSPWVYSKLVRKMFVDKDVSCPIGFRSSPPPPSGSQIRCIMLFTHILHVCDHVTKCPMHCALDTDDESRGYLMKTSAPGRVYEMCPRSGRASVVVPFLEPQDGMDHSMYLFSFGCFSSCPGGMNRRSTQIIFTLENGGEILARKTMDIRICASPGRDFMRSEKQFLSANKCQRPALTQKSENQSDIDSQRSDTERPCKPSPKPRPAKRVCKSEDKGHATIQLDVEKISKKSEADTEVYCLLVRGRENFDLLCRLKEALEVLDHLKAEDIGKYKSTVLPSGKLSEIHDFYAAWKTEVKTKAKEDEPSSVHHESYSVRRSMSLDSMKPH